MRKAVGGCLIPTTRGFYLLPTKLSSGNFQNHIRPYLTPPSIIIDFITYNYDRHWIIDWGWFDFMVGTFPRWSMCVAAFAVHLIIRMLHPGYQCQQRPPLPKFRKKNLTKSWPVAGRKVAEVRWLALARGNLHGRHTHLLHALLLTRCKRGLPFYLCKAPKFCPI